MRIGLIVDNNRLNRWQAEALLKITANTEFFVYNCTNCRPSPRRLRYASYYALRVAALTTRMTRAVGLPCALRIAETLDFECGFDGQWQTLPPWLIEKFREHAPRFLIKFGMGLLRLPPAIDLPILSYHHGDPREFRGRPAGFYELLQNRQTVGQVVQLLSNSLDAGEVIAFAETRTYPHSYRATMDEAYRCSPLLLPVAIRNVTGGIRLPLRPEGKNYRLPSNWTVIRFVAARTAGLARRVAYGLCLEKAWQVAEGPLQIDDSGLPQTLPDPAQWRVIENPAGYRFTADPFYHPSEEGLLVEALRTRTGLGEIVKIDPMGPRKLYAANGHLSYPATLNLNGVTYMLPEMSEWSRPHLFRLTGGIGLDDLGELDIPGHPRLVDPTLFADEEKVFLFANDCSESLSVLRLWFADSPLGPYREHPLSPIRISPIGSRMGGAIIRLADGLLRVGQDLRGSYGDGVVIFRIREISPTRYHEELVGEHRFQGVRGPHTLNFRPGMVAFDFYRDRFSIFAGLRRIRGRVKRQKQHA